jgi:hypothetical protein
VLFGAELYNSAGTRDTRKACLSAVVKKLIAGAPAK